MFSPVQLFSVFAAYVAAQPMKVGHITPVGLNFQSNQGFSHEINAPGADFIKLHFNDLNLPIGARLVVSGANNDTPEELTGHQTDVFADRISGDKLKLEYFPGQNPSDKPVITIDHYVSVDSPSDFFDGVDSIQAVCGADDTQALPCVKESDSAKYAKGQAVARLYIGGRSLCTGWLFGSEGHLITNHHCIGSASDARNVEFEFEAECPSCDHPDNTKKMGCKGKVVASSSKFVTTNVEADYTLVKLNLKSGASLKKYGYLQARESGPVLGEPIYIAQHPAGKPTRIATVLDNGEVGTVEDLSINSCQADEFGYMLDTEGGSSGSPVLSATDNAVVGLHNCGGCLNGGIKIDKVVSDLKTKGLLPQDALA